MTLQEIAEWRADVQARVKARVGGALESEERLLALLNAAETGLRLEQFCVMGQHDLRFVRVVGGESAQPLMQVEMSGRAVAVADNLLSALREVMREQALHACGWGEETT